MTFDTNLAETQQESTPELYELSYGSTIERYTSWDEDLSFLGSTWLAADIQRDGFQQDTDLSETSVQVTAPLTPIVVGYVANAPMQPVRIRIYRALKSDMADYVRIFDGVVKEIAMEKGVATVSVVSRSKYLDVYLPLFVYQAFCNNDLFDGNCGIVDVDWQVPATVSLVSGSTLRATEFDSYDDGYFIGGKVEAGTDFRLITNHVGPDLTLNLAFDASVVVGSSVIAYPGCSGDPAVCTTRYDNFTNFTGMYYIPSRNPVIWGFH